MPQHDFERTTVILCLISQFSTNFFECSDFCTLGAKMTRSSKLSASSGRQYPETSPLDGADGRLEGSLESGEQRLFWHEDPKPGTLV